MYNSASNTDHASGARMPQFFNQTNAISVSDECPWGEISYWCTLETRIWQACGVRQLLWPWSGRRVRQGLGD